MNLTITITGLGLIGGVLNLVFSIFRLLSSKMISSQTLERDLMKISDYIELLSSEEKKDRLRAHRDSVIMNKVLDSTAHGGILKTNIVTLVFLVASFGAAVLSDVYMAGEPDMFKAFVCLTASVVFLVCGIVLLVVAQKSLWSVSRFMMPSPLLADEVLAGEK